MGKASDAAQKKAQELGVDLDSVEGSGSGGNITVADVEKAAAAKTTNDDEAAAGERSAEAEDAPVAAAETPDRDALDAGVEMIPGSGSEPVGPEDALGEGDKRGDYRERQDGATHLESRPVEGGGGPVVNDDGGIDNAPHTELVEQNPRVEEIGEVEGEKGGVTTG